MSKKESESWLNILVPIVILVVAVYLLFDYKPKSERLLEVLQEVKHNNEH